MSNMFSGNTKKRVPKDLKSCYETDSLTKNLWSWCEKIEKLGSFLFWTIILVGLVVAILISVEASSESGFFIAILITLFYAFLEYCAYHIIALLIGSLASIVQHNKITANISLYKVAKEEGFVDDEPKEEKPEPEEAAQEDPFSFETLDELVKARNDKVISEDSYKQQLLSMYLKDKITDKQYLEALK